MWPCLKEQIYRNLSIQSHRIWFDSNTDERSFIIKEMAEPIQHYILNSSDALSGILVLLFAPGQQKKEERSILRLCIGFFGGWWCCGIFPFFLLLIFVWSSTKYPGGWSRWKENTHRRWRRGNQINGSFTVTEKRQKNRKKHMYIFYTLEKWMTRR